MNGCCYCGDSGSCAACQRWAMRPAPTTVGRESLTVLLSVLGLLVVMLTPLAMVLLVKW